MYLKGSCGREGGLGGASLSVEWAADRVCGANPMAVVPLGGGLTEAKGKGRE
jgi:hypothetical protein